jgi:hypothetical protein
MEASRGITGSHGPEVRRFPVTRKEASPPTDSSLSGIERHGRNELSAVISSWEQPSIVNVKIPVAKMGQGEIVRNRRYSIHVFATANLRSDIRQAQSSERRGTCVTGDGRRRVGSESRRR